MLVHVSSHLFEQQEENLYIYITITKNHTWDQKEEERNDRRKIGQQWQQAERFSVRNKVDTYIMDSTGPVWRL